jgi:type II restriction/modification system DNA methylase subunit YeeA
VATRDAQRKEKFSEFLTWFNTHITGRERKEGQIFFDRLLQAFENAGVLEAGAKLEDAVKKKSGRTGFADLVWKPRVIIELKERNTPLKKHYPQAEEYWMQLVPNRPQYMVLCNFDEFWVYDLNTQLNDPVHKLHIKDLPNEWGALAFLFSTPEKPLFANNNVEVTEAAAKIIGSMYRSLQKRSIEAHRAQRFVLQLVVALFAEDVALIPKYTLQKILREAVSNPVTQKELGSLFSAMATEEPAKKPRKYREIPYFNGGLFNSVDPIELSFEELDLLAQASEHDWSKVRPSIFGGIFESSMDPEFRHGHGIHYTSELDIQKIVNPTIIKPFRERIERAKNRKELGAVLTDIQNFKVLDPACGSGNFLYIAFRELRRLEVDILERIDTKFDVKQMRAGWISPKNFFGIDTNEFGLELAKIALSVGRKLSADEFGNVDNVLPFENLEENFVAQDALLSDWPSFDAVIGNPPFQSKNKIQQEMGADYISEVRERFPDVSGMADYCVYWFRKAHDHLRPGARAGLVGTNTIRETNSRESGLDYILANGGTITEAVSSQPWSGDANVHVSIVNWIKGEQKGLKRLFIQRGNSSESPVELAEMKTINSALSFKADVSKAKRLAVSATSNTCFQGQTHGHPGFLLTKSEAIELLAEQKNYSNVLFPFMTTNDLIGTKDSKPKRFVIDFTGMSVVEAQGYKKLFERIKQKVLPKREKEVEKEKARNKKVLARNKSARVNRHHENFLKSWWLMSYPREDLISRISKLERYAVCGRVMKRPIFEFVSSEIHPNDALVAFLFDDDYSFGILQSVFHWEWYTARCSTLTERFRYTSTTIYDFFPWPQSPTLALAKSVAEASRNLRNLRNDLRSKSPQSLRALYRSLELPGDNPLREAHDQLDRAVREAYGFKDAESYLEQLLSLGFDVSELESKGAVVQGPGLPRCVTNKTPFLTKDCISL